MKKKMIIIMMKMMTSNYLFWKLEKKKIKNKFVCFNYFRGITEVPTNSKPLPIDEHPHRHHHGVDKVHFNFLHYFVNFLITVEMIIK